MFGIYRTLLALFVIASHLMSITIIGQYAVHGFFILSGYLMTFIMSRNYRYTMPGIRAFALNRFLRLFPAYWLLCLLIIPIILLSGTQATSQFNYRMGMPGDFTTWLQNISMCYVNLIPMKVGPRLSPPTWALTVELLYYALIAIGISRTRTGSLLWLSLSIAYCLFTHMLGLDKNFRYSAIMAGSLPFAAGAVLYHTMPTLKKHCGWLRTRTGILTIVALFLANNLAGCLVLLLGANDAFAQPFYYLNLLANFCLIFAISDGIPWNLSQKLDGFIGDFSYPLYLFHLPAGLAASMLLFGEARRGFHFDGFLVLCLALPICAAVSLFVIYCVDHPIQRVRAKVRRNANQSQAN